MLYSLIWTVKHQEIKKLLNLLSVSCLYQKHTTRSLSKTLAKVPSVALNVAYTVTFDKLNSILPVKHLTKKYLD